MLRSANQDKDVSTFALIGRMAHMRRTGRCSGIASVAQESSPDEVGKISHPRYHHCRRRCARGVASHSGHAQTIRDRDLLGPWSSTTSPLASRTGTNRLLHRRSQVALLTASQCRCGIAASAYETAAQLDSEAVIPAPGRHYGGLERWLARVSNDGAARFEQRQ